MVGDFLRGRKGIMLDMYRYPEKLEAVAEKLLPMAIEMGIRGARMSGNPRVFIAVHGGVEGFMSVEQYKRFYWPTLQALLVALADAGLNPFVLVEGSSNSRLEMMAEVPAGKICYWFDHVDMRRAKEVLGGTACIAGNVPIALLTVGTPDARPRLLQGPHRHGRPGRRLHHGRLRADGGREDREREGHGGLHQGVRRVDRQRAGASPGGAAHLRPPLHRRRSRGIAGTLPCLG